MKKSLEIIFIILFTLTATLVAIFLTRPVEAPNLEMEQPSQTSKNEIATTTSTSSLIEESRPPAKEKLPETYVAPWGETVTLLRSTVVGVPFDFVTDSETCHAFEIISENNEIITKYKNHVTTGNSLNRLSERGNLVITLPWDTLSEEEKKRISAANTRQPISVELSEKQPLYAGVSSCYAVFDVKVL